MEKIYKAISIKYIKILKIITLIWMSLGLIGLGLYYGQNQSIIKNNFPDKYKHSFYSKLDKNQ